MTTSPRCARRLGSTRWCRSTSPCATPAAAPRRACAPSTTRSRRRSTSTRPRQFCHCFGCGEGGDVFTFLMKIDGLSFVEAVERLAEKYGVQLRREDGRRPRRPAQGPAAQPADRGATGSPRSSTPSSSATPDALVGAAVPARARLRPGRRRHVRRRVRPARRRGAVQAPAAEGLQPGGDGRGRAWSRSGGRRTTGSAGGCSGRSATPAATPSASARAGSSTTTRSRRSTSTPPRPRSTRRARCSTASTWPAATWRGRRRRSWSRATPT